MLKIMTLKSFLLLQADLAQARRERDALKESLDILAKHMNRKSITVEDVRTGKASIMWHPGKAPRVNVREMMRKERVA